MTDMHAGIGYPVQIPRLHELHQKRIRNSGTGSRVLLNSQVVRLIQENQGIPGSRIIGAVVRRGQSEYIQVNAKVVVLATGGFQGSKQLTSTHLGPGGSNIFVRSNPGSVGDGLNLAVAAGAGTSRGLDTYYGHLMAAPLRAENVDPNDFKALAQYRKIMQNMMRFSVLTMDRKQILPSAQ